MAELCEVPFSHNTKPLNINGLPAKQERASSPRPKGAPSCRRSGKRPSKRARKLEGQCHEEGKQNAPASTTTFAHLALPEHSEKVPNSGGEVARPDSKRGVSLRKDDFVHVEA